jgi:hypothetical protein
VKAPALVGRLLALFGFALLAGCSEQAVVAELRSLSGSEDVVFVCRDDRGVGHPYADCPDRDATDDTHKARHLSVLALVSQTVTDEVAVVDVSAGHVVDVDPATPGYGFLRVGGRPVSMAATPGGTATFVATADVGRNGIFALPTSCLGAPQAGELQRDLTSWAACRLDETPGEMAVMVEPPTTDAASLPAGVDPSCATPYTEDDAPVDAQGEPTNPACPADLRSEGGVEGRRKLVVALPDSGRVVVFDAQTLLKQAPGAFPSCTPLIERSLPLQVEVPAGVAQTLPADLVGACSDAAVPTAPAPDKRSPQPAGLAVSDDRLYIADQAAPVIHVLDTTSVCGMTELPSLLPMSLREPERVVTTRRVAISPLTPAGRRFAYAIDAEDQPGASVMVFDVSPGATDKTPLVRSGSPELPGEKPDRLALAASAKDVTFAYRDIPYVDPATGVAQFGVRCDPDPAAAADTPGVLARSSSDFLTGARPGLLRGLFGFILLTNGSIAVVDEDDFDSDCRRPISANPEAAADFRGCVGDKIAGGVFAQDPQNPEVTRTVTGEVSCRVVEPHRFRSLQLAINDPTIGVRAPSLRGFPQLTLPASTSSSPVEDRPRLLGVPFEGPTGQRAEAEVFVGSTRYVTSNDAASSDVLPTDPNSRVSDLLQSLNAVVLPPLEPRSYAADDTVTLTYEGSYSGDRSSGFLTPSDTDASQLVLKDDALSFCAAGVYDAAAMSDYAGQELGLDGIDAPAFGQAHADFVQLLTALPDAADAYWSGLDRTREKCLGMFGAEDAETLSPARDFQVVSAFAGRLVLTPRKPNLAAPITATDVTTCFPTAQKYRLRAGAHWVLFHSAFGFRHDVVASGPDSACLRSCNPLKKWEKGRVFEISSQQQNDKNEPACRSLDPDAMQATGDPLDLRVGCAADGEVACVFDQTQQVTVEGTNANGDPTSRQIPNAAVQLGTPAAKCIFNGLRERFALYRGRADSVRDATFTWQTTGGFTPLVMSLSAVSTVVSPQSIQFLPQPEQMAVVDGSSLGLSLFSLDTFSVVAPSPFF